MNQLEFKVTIIINQDNIGMLNDNDVATLLKHDLEHWTPRLGNMGLVEDINVEEI